MELAQKNGTQSSKQCVHVCPIYHIHGLYGVIGKRHHESYNGTIQKITAVDIEQKKKDLQDPLDTSQQIGVLFKIIDDGI